jgi:hypothetical protein
LSTRPDKLSAAPVANFFRAGQGMVIFVPPRAKHDKKRSPGFYQDVSEYLTDLGVPQV